MKKNPFLVIFFCLLVVSQGDHHVSKRSLYLFFPPGGVLQFTYGLSVPLVLPRRSINITWGVQSQHNLPRNNSLLVPNTIDVRSNPIKFDLPRITFYEYLSKILDGIGLHGKHCIYRSICEIAEIPMYKKEDSTLEKIVDYLFTPSLDLSEKEGNRTFDQSQSAFTKKILRAEKWGKSDGKCEEKYSKCIISLIDLMTVLYVT